MCQNSFKLILNMCLYLELSSLFVLLIYLSFFINNFSLSFDSFLLQTYKPTQVSSIFQVLLRTHLPVTTLGLFLFTANFIDILIYNLTISLAPIHSTSHTKILKINYELHVVKPNGNLTGFL